MKINDSNYAEVLAQGKPVVLDFWATWCGPCKMVGPIIEQLSTEYADRVVIGKVDVEDEADDLVSQFGIRNVPTVVFLKDGQVVDKLVGNVPKAEITSRLDAIL